MIIDILVVLFIIIVFVSFGYSRYKAKKNGIVGCGHCLGCAQVDNCKGINK